jgi:hypothetical protein
MSWLRLTTQMQERMDVSVCDITGREVMRLYAGVLPQGVHAFPIDVATLGAGGIYTVNVQTQTAREVLKLVVGK